MGIVPELTPSNISFILRPYQNRITRPFLCQLDVSLDLGASIMKCPKCQSDNREGVKFCNECGHKFDLTCPDCGITNRPGAKFCDECGHKLTLPSETIPKDLSFEKGDVHQ